MNKFLSSVSATLTLILLHTLLSLSAFGQAQENPTGLVTGRITERITGQPIANAKVIIEAQKEVLTDDDGRYRIELAPGSYNGKITAAGYAPIALGIITVTAKYTSVYDAKLDVQVTDETTVTGGYFIATADQPISNVTLRRAEIRAMPGTGGDVLRVIGSLPGVSSAGAQFADLLVRGGMPGENLTFIDNIPIGDFTYFNDQYDGGRGGRGAVLAPDVFDRLEFSAGGFGVRYGDRMSSALDVTLRKANRNRVQGSIFTDSGNAGASIEVPLGERAGWFFSARRSYIDFALDLFNIGDIGKPRNLDFINKLDFDLNARHKLSLTAMNFNDRATIPLESAQKIGSRRDQLVTERSSKRFIVGATLSSLLGEKTFSNLTAWGIGEHNDGSFLRLDQRTLQRQRDLRETNFGLKDELTTSFSPRLNLAAGGGVIVQQGTLSSFELTGVGYSLVGEEYRAPTRNSLLRLGNTANAYGYAQLAWQINARLSLTPGLRLDRYGLTSQTLVSPRASARLRLAPGLALNFATGIYHQPPPTYLLSLTPANRSLAAQRATHFISGLEWQLREDTRVTIEAYQKNYDNLLVQPTRSAPNYFNTGDGYARGIEFAAQKALTGRWAGQAAYAYTFARLRFAPGSVYFPSEVVRPHQLTLIGMTRLKGWILASKLRVASGLPYSKLEPVAAPAPTLWELRDPTNRNAINFPRFIQLDLRVEKKFDYRRWSFAPYADFFNLTKHRNVTDVTYRSTRNVNFLAERKLIPIIGARVEF